VLLVLTERCARLVCRGEEQQLPAGAGGGRPAPPTPQRGSRRARATEVGRGAGSKTASAPRGPVGGGGGQRETLVRDRHPQAFQSLCYGRRLRTPACTGIASYAASANRTASTLRSPQNIILPNKSPRIDSSV